MRTSATSNPCTAEAGRRLSCGLALALLLALAAGSARAESEAPLAALTGSALDLATAARAAAPDDGVVLYAGATLDQALLREVRVQVDSDAPLRYQFNESEARALNAGGLHRLAVLPLTPGPHRLRAEFRGREAGGRPGAATLAARFDGTLAVDAASAAYELRLLPGGLVGAATLQLLTAGGDLAAREAETLLAGDRAFEAALLFAASPSVDPARREAARVALGLQSAAETRVPAIDHYNAAAGGEGEAALAQLGDAKAEDAEALAVRDLANLTLAYRALRAGRGDVAAERFKRVRSPGPYSSAAMLGLGWSYLVPSAAGDGATAVAVALRPGDEDAVAAARRQTPFRYLQAVAKGERAEDIRRALIPWSELIGRDPLDPAVQEGMLAIPYALDHLGAHAQAQRYYERAVGDLEGARRTLAAARGQVSNGHLLEALDARDADAASGWSHLLVERRDDDEAVPLHTLAEAPAVAAALRDYRLLQEIDRGLAAAAARVGGRDASLAARIDDLRARIAAARTPAAQRAQAAMDGELQRLDRHAAQYLAEAEFALARIDDREPHGEAK